GRRSAHKLLVFPVMTTEIITKARNGVWTPWAQVLCIECDYRALKNSGDHADRYAKHLHALESKDRTAEVPREDGNQLGYCDTCRTRCWARSDVALLQQVGFRSSDLDWDGPFGWSLQQTGGMCAALVFTIDGREIVVTAMDGFFYVGEYARAEGADSDWDSPIRTWQSGPFGEADTQLAALVEQCAGTVIEWLRAPKAP